MFGCIGEFFRICKVVLIIIQQNLLSWGILYCRRVVQFSRHWVVAEPCYRVVGLLRLQFFSFNRTRVIYLPIMRYIPQHIHTFCKSWFPFELKMLHLISRNVERWLKITRKWVTLDIFEIRRMSTFPRYLEKRWTYVSTKMWFEPSNVSRQLSCGRINQPKSRNLGHPVQC